MFKIIDGVQNRVQIQIILDEPPTPSRRVGTL